MQKKALSMENHGKPFFQLSYMCNFRIQSIEGSKSTAAKSPRKGCFAAACIGHRSANSSQSNQNHDNSQQFTTHIHNLSHVLIGVDSANVNKAFGFASAEQQKTNNGSDTDTTCPRIDLLPST